MAATCVHVMGLTDEDYAARTEPMVSHINVGTGLDVNIRELAETVKDVVGFEGGLVFDPSRPDGTPRKHLYVSRLAALGWTPSIGLRERLEATYRWFLESDQVRE